jgi:ubiquinone/menaquinone biosynthesis C-methylase UbiE
VWAIDISPKMCDYLKTKAKSAGLDNIETVAASIVSLPLVEDSVDVVISNYCFHHLDEAGKVMALEEIRRVLAPGGRIVIGDMMFSATLADPRSRGVARQKVRAMFAKGIPGMIRLARNAGRYAAGRWERPAGPDWWNNALRSLGFEGVEVRALEHEGGVAVAHKPLAPDPG